MSRLGALANLPAKLGALARLPARLGADRATLGALGRLPARLGADLAWTQLGWAFMRIGYHAAVLWLLCDLWVWRESAFASSPSAGPPLLAAGFIANALLVTGWKTRPLLVANALLLRGLFALCEDPYTVDEIVENFSLVLAFAPRPAVLAVDCRGQPPRPREPLPRPFCILVYVAVVLLYEDSVVHKLGAEVWQDGSILWLASVLPHVGNTSFPEWAEQAWLFRSAAYAALAYEALFPLVAFRRLRPILCATGILMHATTGLLYPLPQFALVMVATLLLFMPRADPAPTRATIRTTPAWTAPLAVALAAAMTVSQIDLVRRPWEPRSRLSRLVSTYPHPIFIDWHFRLRAPILRYTTEIDGREVVIPSFDEDGRPAVRDRYWKVLAFSLRGDRRGPDMMARYLRAWLLARGAQSATVTLWCRDVRLPRLELDFGLAEELASRRFTRCGQVELAPGPPGE
jgi:hypothetical protein